MDNKMEIDDDETMRSGISKAALKKHRNDSLKNTLIYISDLEFQLHKNAYDLRKFLESNAYELEEINRSRISAEKRKIEIQYELNNNP
jgi:hypothetical protein